MCSCVGQKLHQQILFLSFFFPVYRKQTCSPYLSWRTPLTFISLSFCTVSSSLLSSPQQKVIKLSSTHDANNSGFLSKSMEWLLRPWKCNKQNVIRLASIHDANNSELLSKSMQWLLWPWNCNKQNMFRFASIHDANNSGFLSKSLEWLLRPWKYNKQNVIRLASTHDANNSGFLSKNNCLGPEDITKQFYLKSSQYLHQWLQVCNAVVPTTIMTSGDHVLTKIPMYKTKNPVSSDWLIRSLITQQCCGYCKMKRL